MGIPLRTRRSAPLLRGHGWPDVCGRPDGGAELLDCRLADGAGTRAPGKDDLDVLDPDPG
jgi:hypothetical protein